MRDGDWHGSLACLGLWRRSGRTLSRLSASRTIQGHPATEARCHGRRSSAVGRNRRRDAPRGSGGDRPSGHASGATADRRSRGGERGRTRESSTARFSMSSSGGSTSRSRPLRPTRTSSTRSCSFRSSMCLAIFGDGIVAADALELKAGSAILTPTLVTRSEFAAGIDRYPFRVAIAAMNAFAAIDTSRFDRRERAGSGTASMPRPAG